MDNLLEKEPELHKIVFNSAAPEISPEALSAIHYALNKPRPFCSKDSVPVYFIADMHQDIR